MTAPREPLALPSRLYAIVDADACAAAGHDLVEFVDVLLGEGVRLLQLRAKHAAPRDVLTWADAIAARVHGVPGTLFVVNDRADVALAAGVPHVHVGQDDLAPADVRELLGPRGVIGLSTHTPEQVVVACAAPVDYIAVGPVFGTTTKDTGYAPVGVDLVRQASAAARGADPRRPLVAIGGITPETCGHVIEAGADAVAVISGLLEGHPAAAVRRYRRALGE